VTVLMISAAVCALTMQTTGKRRRSRPDTHRARLLRQRIGRGQDNSTSTGGVPGAQR
jgi:hypothetical protein